MERGAAIGEGTYIWANAHIRADARIGSECVIGDGAYVDTKVTIGARCKIQNAVQLFHGVELADGVFVGPAATFTNDLSPRAVNPDGTLRSGDDWIVSRTIIRHGAAIGANATIVSGITVGEWAMIGAGAVVTRDVAAHSLVVGTPARHIGWVCSCGRRLANQPDDNCSCGS